MEPKLSLEFERPIAWPHAPTHCLSESGTYIVTGATLEKCHHFRSAERLGVLHRGLLEMARKYDWQLEAWAVFSNHYHFIGHSPTGETDALSLSPMLTELHAETARWANRLDGTDGRQVWYNFWETRLSFEKSYLARLNYVHKNPVRHGLVPRAALYPWGSAAWFERTAKPAQVRTIYGFKIDQVRILDDYEVDEDW